MMGLTLPAARKDGCNPASPAPHGGAPPAQSVWHTPGNHRWSGLVPGLLNRSKNNKTMKKGKTPPTGGATPRRAILWGNNLLLTQSVVLMRYYHQASHAFLQSAPDPLNQPCKDRFRGQREAQARL